MKYFIKSYCRERKKGLIRLGIIFSVFFLLILFSTIYIVNISEVHIRQTILEQFKRHQVEVSFDDNITFSRFLRPKVTIKNVQIKFLDYQSFPSIKTKEATFYLGLSTYLGNVSLQKIRVKEPEIDLFKVEEDKDYLLNWFNGINKIISTLPDHIEIINGAIRIYQDNIGLKLRIHGINGFLEKLNNQSIAINIEGYLFNFDEESNPLIKLSGIVTNNKESLVFNNGALISENIIPKMGKVNVQSEFKLTLNKQDFSFIFNHLGILLSNEIDTQIKINVESSQWKNNIFSIPQIHINGQRKIDNQNINLISNITEGSCTEKACSFNHVKFGLNYSDDQTNYVLNGTSTLETDLNESTLILGKMVLNTQAKNNLTVFPLLNFDLKGHLFYKHNELLRSSMDGSLDDKAFRINSFYDNDEDKINKWKFDISIDQLNLNPYLKLNEDQPIETSINSFLSFVDQYIDFEKDKYIAAHINIGLLKLNKFIFENFYTNFISQKNEVLLENTRAKFYGGAIKGQLKVSKNDQKFNMFISNELNNIDVGLMLLDIINYPILSGIGNVKFNLSSSGKEYQDLLSNMKGPSELSITEGSINGVNFKDIIHNDNIQNWTYDDKKSSPFSRLYTTINWNNGVGDPSILTMISDQMNIEGSGIINIVKDLIDFKLSLKGKINVDNQMKNVDLPLSVSGNFYKPIYSLDSKEIEHKLKNNRNKNNTLQKILRQQWELMK